MVNSRSIDRKYAEKKTQNGQVDIQVDAKSPNGKFGFKLNWQAWLHQAFQLGHAWLKS